MAHLITTPTFTFSQGDIFDGAELPVQVIYHNNCNDKPLIVLEQGENFINFTSLGHLKALVKQVEKHHEEAKLKLKL